MGFVAGLRTLWAILKREFSVYFISPIFYFLGGAFLLLTGLFFTLVLILQLNQGTGQPDMSGTFLPTSFMLLFFVPLLTMRLLAEETRQGTLELLLTRPVRDWQVVVGKFLAAWGVQTLLLLITVIYALILVWRGNPDRSVILSGYLGLWLMAGSMIAVGVLMSALTRYQLVAGVLTLGALLMLWLFDIATPLVNVFATGTSGTFRNVATEVLSNLTIRSHYHQTMLNGLVNATDLAYFVLLMALSLFLATRVLEARRWRS